MPVTRDPSCALIERPPAPRRAAEQTPHAEAIIDKVAVAGVAVDVLLGMQFLIREVSVTPDETRIRLERTPPVNALRMHSLRGGLCVETDELIGWMDWRGVRIEWPLAMSPDAERVARAVIAGRAES